jgi:hypothetical protein
MSLIVKDSTNKQIGQIFNSMGSRKKTFKLEDQEYLIEFPLTWKRTAILHAPNGTGVIAKYVNSGWFSRHEFELKGYGVLKSDSDGLNFKAAFNYKLNDKLIGTRQNISSTLEKGRLLILPSDLPMAMKLFILSV